MIVEPLSQHLRLYLLPNLHTSGGTKSLLWSAIMIFRNIGEKSNTYLLDITVNSKLTCGQGSHHEQASADAGITAAQSEFFGNLDQTASCPFTGKPAIRPEPRLTVVCMPEEREFLSTVL
jgi:hypothetical protein